MTVELHGFTYSVYTWTVRAVLSAKGVAYTEHGVNPFTDKDAVPHPFGKVPVLTHDGFRLYETAAILRYIDRAFIDPAMQSPKPRIQA